MRPNPPQERDDPAPGRDSSRLRRAEQLQTSEIRFRAAIEGGFDAFFCFDCELDDRGATFRLSELNSRGAALLGGTKESLVGKTFAEIAEDEEGTAFFTARFLRVYESGTPLEEEYEVRSPKVSARWLQFQIVPMLSGVAVSARDITDEKESSRALRESEERVLSIIQHVPGVFFTLVPSDDREDGFRFEFVSDAIEKLTGHAVAEFFGPDRVTLQSLLLLEDQPLIDRVDQKILAGHPFAIDARIVDRAGAVRWAHLKVEPKFDETGAVSAASGVMLDITDRKDAEEALHLRERAMEALAQGVVITDATQSDLPIVYVNPGYEQLTGLSPAELIGRPADALADPTDESVEAEIQAAIAEGRPYAAEYECQRKEGHVFWCTLLLSPVRDDTGAITHWVSISSDESARKRLEEHVVQAQKLEAVGRLAGGVAHDFNNLLLVIRGYSHVLMTMLGEEEQGWSEAKEIETAATRASELIQQLLAFSRSQVMQTQVVDLNALLLTMQTLLKSMLGEDVEFVAAFDPRLGSVTAEPEQLEQTIVNLVVNARDSMPQGGTLTIGTRNVTVDGQSEDAPHLSAGTYSTITVADTGMGMDAETRGHAFEPFFSTKVDGKGTGLGLSSAYGLIKQSGGDITVTSAPDQGTAVTIYLPHAQESGAEFGLRDSARHGQSAGETVLLVEDNDNARALVGRILRESGFCVYEEGLPEDALRFCDEHEGRIDLLLSDVGMPQMSGPTLAKHILDRRPDTRVLFVSGYVESADDVDIVCSGSDFLQKPFTPAELLDTVRRVLGEPDKVTPAQTTV